MSETDTEMHGEPLGQAPRRRARGQLEPIPFDAAAERIVTTVSGGGRGEVSPADYELVTTTLTRFALRFGATADEAEELASEIVNETVAKLMEPDPPSIRRPAAYLFWTTRNRLVDKRRRPPHVALSDDAIPARYYGEEDNAVARLLDQRASIDLVQDALRAASAAGDHLTVRVIAAWMTLAAETGSAPRSRPVAAKAQLSHTSVNQALKRFRNYFPDEGLSTS